MLIELFVLAPVLSAAWGAADGPPVPFPHPLLTELLFAVPAGAKGDASGDGVRDAVGDEFVELVNPHDRPIQLKGYTITDGTPADPMDPPKIAPGAGGERRPGAEPSEADRKQVRFAFPALELKPGEVVVVFNGYKQKLAAPVGDSRHAPAAKNERFFGAYVFSMRNDSQYIAFANTADCMILWDPDGKPVEAIHWRHSVRAGKGTEKDAPVSKDRAGDAKSAPKIAGPGPASDRAVPPPGTILVEPAPESRGSVARDGTSRKLVAHTELPDSRGELFSPGRVDPASTDGGGTLTKSSSPK